MGDGKDKGKAHRALRLALLLLVGHAFLAGAAHNHLAGTQVKASPSFASTALGHDGAETGREAARHAECLLCRLQRNLVAELDSPASVVAAPPQKFACAGTSPVSFRPHDSLRAPAGRAPPLA